MTNPSPDTSAEAVAKPAAYVVKLNYGSGRWSGDMLTDFLPSDDSQYQLVDRLYSGAQFDTSRAETAAANARADALERERDDANKARGVCADNAGQSADEAMRLQTEVADLKARLGMAREALTELVDTLTPATNPAFPDPLYHQEVKALGKRIGFGALMSTASAGWREAAAENGNPPGGEFTAGPCFGVLVKDVERARRTLTEIEGKSK